MFTGHTRAHIIKKQNTDTVINNSYSIFIQHVLCG